MHTVSTISPFRAAAAALALSAMGGVCRAQGAPSATSETAAFVVSAKPATLTVRDLRALRWIEGSWRGSGGGQKPFFERYAFVDDSTLRVESLADSTLTHVSETTFYELRGGRFANRSTTARWVAVRLKDRAITFAPDVGVRNAFVWRPSTRDAWYADIVFLAPLDKSRPAAPARTYEMVRVTQSAGARR